MATFLYAPSDEDLKLRPDDIASMGLQQGEEDEEDDVFPTISNSEGQDSFPMQNETDFHLAPTAAAVATHDRMGQDLAEVDTSNNRWSHRSSHGQNASYRSSVGHHQQHLRGETPNAPPRSILDVLGRDSVASVQSLDTAEGLPAFVCHNDALADAMMDAFGSRGSEGRFSPGMGGQDGVRTPGRPRVTGGISSSTAPGSTGRGLTLRVGNTSILKGNAFAEATSSLMDQHQQVANHNGLSVPSTTANKAMNKLALLRMGSTRNRPQIEQQQQQQQRLQSRQGSSTLSSPEPGHTKAPFPGKSDEIDEGLDLPINTSSETNLSASRPPEFAPDMRRTTSLRVNPQEDGSEGAAGPSPLGSSSTTNGMAPPQGKARRPITRRDSNVNVIHNMMKLMSQAGGTTVQKDYEI